MRHRPNALKTSVSSEDSAASVVTPVSEKMEPVPKGRLKVAQDEILGKVSLN
jgi:hypothetical protein